MMPSTREAFSFLRDPEKIYRDSRRIIEEEVDFTNFPKELHPVIARMIHSCGMPNLTESILSSGNDVVAAAQAAFEEKKPILTDSMMTRYGIQNHRLPHRNDVLCFLDEPHIEKTAKELETTRSAAAIEHWHPYIDKAVLVIGNAPTALFHLLNKLQAGWPKPRLIIGMPVGFVGAAESKQALCDYASDTGIPFLSVKGRLGGSAMAAASINAMLPITDAFHQA